MRTYTIKHNGEIKAEVRNQSTDLCVFKVLHKMQSQSVWHAIKYEGWAVIETDEETGESIIWYAKRNGEITFIKPAVPAVA